jgi:hypothetical protein
MRGGRQAAKNFAKDAGLFIALLQMDASREKKFFTAEDAEDRRGYKEI